MKVPNRYTTSSCGDASPSSGKLGKSEKWHCDNTEGEMIFDTFILHCDLIDCSVLFDVEMEAACTTGIWPTCLT